MYPKIESRRDLAEQMNRLEVEHRKHLKRPIPDIAYTILKNIGEYFLLENCPISFAQLQTSIPNLESDQVSGAYVGGHGLYKKGLVVQKTLPDKSTYIYPLGSQPRGVVTCNYLPLMLEEKKIQYLGSLETDFVDYLKHTFPVLGHSIEDSRIPIGDLEDLCDDHPSLVCDDEFIYWISPDEGLKGNYVLKYKFAKSIAEAFFKKNQASYEENYYEVRDHVAKIFLRLGASNSLFGARRSVAKLLKNLYESGKTEVDETSVKALDQVFQEVEAHVESSDANSQIKYEEIVASDNFLKSRTVTIRGIELKEVAEEYWLIIEESEDEPIKSVEISTEIQWINVIGGALEIDTLSDYFKKKKGAKLSRVILCFPKKVFE